MRLMQNEPGRRESRPSKDRKQPIGMFSGGSGSPPAVWEGAGQGYGDAPRPDGPRGGNIFHRVEKVGRGRLIHIVSKGRS